MTPRASVHLHVLRRTVARPVPVRSSSVTTRCRYALVPLFSSAGTRTLLAEPTLAAIWLVTAIHGSIPRVAKRAAAGCGDGAPPDSAASAEAAAGLFSHAPSSTGAPTAAAAAVLRNLRRPTSAGGAARAEPASLLGSWGMGPLADGWDGRGVNASPPKPVRRADGVRMFAVANRACPDGGDSPHCNFRTGPGRSRAIP